jgi:hypothetical protein
MNRIKLFVLALLCLHVTQLSIAQQDTSKSNYNPNISYTANMDSAFANISKQYIGTGILYNRVLPMANLHLLSNGGIVSPSLYWQAYHELYLASLSSSKILDITQAKLKNAYYRQQGIISLGIINCNFTMLKDSITEADSMLVVRNNVLYEGPQIAKAFVTKRATFAALLCDRLEPGKRYTVDIGNIMLENNSIKVDEVSISFKKTRGDGPIKLHATKEIMVNEVGAYDAIVTLKMSNGEILEYWQNIEVGNNNSKRMASSLSDMSCWPAPYVPAPPNTAIPAGRITANEAIMGISGQADVQVYFRTNGLATNSPCPSTIAKPIIVIDGIDDGNLHGADWIYAEKLIFTNPNQTNTTDSFRQIADSLRLMGNDVVIFNPRVQDRGAGATPQFIDGGDDLIERNAMTLVTLIQDLNNDMAVQNAANGQPIEPIVICGPSMGGQISRYALAWMEAQDAAGVPNMKHNCRLWLSLDSPHLGANISIGLQQYIKMLAQVTGSAAAYSTYNGYLCAPASRQQLIHQTDHDSSSSVCNVLMDNSAPERAAWMNTLNTFGYPSKCRNIALSNGSSMGGYYRSPGADLIGLQVGNSNNAKLDFMSRQLAETGFSSTTFEASFTHLAGVKGVWLKNWWNPFAIVPTYATDQLASCTITNNSVFGAIDACPGSFYDVQSTIRTSINDGVVSGIAAAVDSLATVNTS